MNTKKIHGIGKKSLILWTFFIMGLGVFQAQAQFAQEYPQADSVFLLKHSPLKATFLSAVVPGLGQIYNEKYWKVPVIYAGFTGLIYYANYNNYVYNKYKDAYNIKKRIEAGETALTDPFPVYDETIISRKKEEWRRYRDLTYISMGLLYVAQIIDANVDANLFDFDMSEDLSLRVEPTVNQMAPLTIGESPSAMVGVRCAIRF